MPTGSKESAKIIIIIVLFAVFVLMAYFRFIHGKVTVLNLSPGTATFLPLLEVPAVDIKGVQTATQTPEHNPQPLRAKLRNIFASAKGSVAGVPSSTAAAEPLKPLPPLKLAGTIIGGKRPIAIINGRLLWQGDHIEGLQVAAIAKDQVLLTAGARRVALNLLEGMKELTPQVTDIKKEGQ